MAIGAVIDTESFGWSTNWSDFVTYAKWSSTGANPALVQGAAPFGDNAITIGGGAVTVYKTLPQTLTKFTAGFRVFPIAVTTMLAFLDNAANIQVCLQFNPFGTPNGQIGIFSGGSFPFGHGNSQIGLTPTPVIPVRQWVHITADVVVDAVNGFVTLYVNGAPVYSIGPTNTAQGSANGVEMIGLLGGGDGIAQMDFAHWYLQDQSAQTGNPPWGNPFGAPRVQCILPSGAGLHTEFSPEGAASNWQAAATVPPDPSSVFNQDATVGAQDNFVTSGFDTAFSEIFAANVKTIAGVTTGGVRTMSSTIISAGTLAEGTAVSLGSPRQIPGIFQTDPATGVAWTFSGIEAAEPGYIIAS